MNAIALINNMHYKAERLLLMGSFALLAALFCSYMYLLSMSVVHVVISKEAETGIHDLRSKIAALESEYMEMQNSLSQDIVEQKGYVAVSKKIFIDRGGNDLVTRR